MEHPAIACEYAMWKAASHKDREAFMQLVPPDAVMVCGGYRCLGKEYAEWIRTFSIDGYAIRNMEIVDKSGDAAALHYVLSVQAEKAKDLEGTFHVVSLWKKEDGGWKLRFNMDAKIL